MATAGNSVTVRTTYMHPAVLPRVQSSIDRYRGRQIDLLKTSFDVVPILAGSFDRPQSPDLFSGAERKAGQEREEAVAGPLLSGHQDQNTGPGGPQGGN